MLLREPRVSVRHLSCVSKPSDSFICHIFKQPLTTRTQTLSWNTISQMEHNYTALKKQSHNSNTITELWDTISQMEHNHTALEQNLSIWILSHNWNTISQMEHNRQLEHNLTTETQSHNANIFTQSRTHSHNLNTISQLEYSHTK